MSVAASAVINIVRDLIPDPSYDGSGNPQPSTDGQLFRVQTLYRFLNDGTKALSEQTGWLVNDWTALAVTANQPWYAIDSKFHQLDIEYQNSFQLALAPESFTIWPTAVVGGQSINCTLHRMTDHLEIGLFPVPNTSDPTTTINQGGGIGATDSTMTVGSTTGFLAYGYLQIDSEIIAYRKITATTVTVMLRGQCGTAAATHLNGATVTHLSAWFKGARMPAEIAVATDTVEIPLGFQYALQEYVLSKCNYAQNDIQGGKHHMDEFRKECARIKSDPGWRSDAQGCSVIPWGMPLSGRLAWGPWGVIVP